MRPVPAIAVAVGAVALAIAGVTAISSSSRPAVVEADTPPGLAIAAGRVVDDHGSPQAGVRVQLVAWPSVDQLAAQKVGETLPMRVVDVATTARDGSYRVGPASAAELTALRGSGTLDLEVYVDGIETPASFSVPAGVPSDRVPVQALDNIVRRGGAAGSPKGAVRTAHRPGVQWDHALGACTPISTTLLSTSIVPVKLGEAHVKNINARASFTYTSGASSSLGVGVSVSGTYGTFSSAGTVTRSWSTTIGFPNVTTGQSKSFGTSFQYGRYQVKCYALNIGPAEWWYQYEFRPIVLWGGTSMASVTPRDSSRCTQYLATATQSNETASAYTWTTGAQTAGFIGINLSSKTGHNAASKIVYTFGTTGWLCAVYGASPATAQVAVAKP